VDGEEAQAPPSDWSVVQRLGRDLRRRRRRHRDARLTGSSTTPKSSPAKATATASGATTSTPAPAQTGSKTPDRSPQATARNRRKRAYGASIPTATPSRRRAPGWKPGSALRASPPSRPRKSSHPPDGPLFDRRNWSTFRLALTWRLPLRRRKPVISRALRSGRYWARTSDPQLVDSRQTFAPVRSCSLKPVVCRDSATGLRTRPNLSEQRALPLLPRVIPQGRAPDPGSSRRPRM